MNFFVRKRFNFLLSSFIAFWYVRFYDVKETNIINHEKFFERVATPAEDSKNTFSRWGPASKVMEPPKKL